MVLSTPFPPNKVVTQLVEYIGKLITILPWSSQGMNFLLEIFNFSAMILLRLFPLIHAEMGSGFVCS